MSRRVYLLGLGLALVALAFLLTDALLWRPGVTESNSRRVRSGMALQEVEIILGGPPRWRTWGSLLDEPAQHAAWWYGKDGNVRVDLDDRQQATRVSFERNAEALGPLARLRAWLGW